MNNSITEKNKNWLVTGLSLLLIVVITLGVFLSGCVQGLVPVGWSGGVVTNDVLYVGSTEGRMVMIDVKDESMQWSNQITAASKGGLSCIPYAGSGGCSGGGGVAIYGTPVVSGELVYMAGYNGRIYAYTADSLASRWVYPREGYLEPFVGGIAVKGGYLFIGCTDGNVYSLDAETGDPLWTYKTDNKIWATPAVDEDTIYIGSFNEKFYAFNLSGNEPKWVFDNEGELGAVISEPLIYDDMVYFGSLDKNLYGLDKETGKLKWKYEGNNWFWAKPVIYNGKIYAGCLDNMIYVLDANNGNWITEYDMGSPLSSSPIIIDGAVIFASKKGVIASIDTETGILNRLAALEDVQIQGPLTGHDGIIYVHTQDKKMHRINAINGSILRTIDLAMP
jgi:outer membrane protein assembly factor BamB